MSGPRTTPDGSRIPPHDLEAEQALIGAMLLTRDAIDAAIAVGTDPDDFYAPAHGHVYESVTGLYGRGEPIDPITVADDLRRRGLLEAVGGPGSIIALLAAPLATGNAARYARIVQELAQLRRLISVGAEITQMGWAVPEDVEATLEQARSLVAGLARTPEVQVDDQADLPGMPSLSRALPSLGDLPDVWPPWVADHLDGVVRSTGCDPNLAYGGFLGVGSGLARGRVSVELKNGAWTERAMKFVLLVAGPASRKSEVMRHITGPFREQAKVDFDRAVEQAQQEVADVIGDPARLMAARGHLESLTRTAGWCIGGDLTPEALKYSLQAGAGHVLVADDEGSFLQNVIGGRYSSTGTPNLSLLNKSYTGDDHSILRSGSAAVMLRSPQMSICLMVQPSVMRAAYAVPEFATTGTHSRCLVVPCRGVEVAEEGAEERFDRAAADAYAWEVRDRLRWWAAHERVVLALTPEVERLVVAYSREMTGQAVAVKDHDPVLASWLERRPGALLRSMVEAHVIWVPATEMQAAPLDMDDYRRGWAMSEWESGTSDATAGLQTGYAEEERMLLLVGWLTAHRQTGGWSARDLLKKRHRHYERSTEVRADLEEAWNRGLLAQVPRTSDYRPDGRTGVVSNGHYRAV